MGARLNETDLITWHETDRGIHDPSTSKTCTSCLTARGSLETVPLSGMLSFPSHRHVQGPQGGNRKSGAKVLALLFPEPERRKSISQGVLCTNAASSEGSAPTVHT